LKKVLDLTERVLDWIFA